jgi:hypothetical protein
MLSSTLAYPSILRCEVAVTRCLHATSQGAGTIDVLHQCSPEKIFCYLKQPVSLQLQYQHDKSVPWILEAISATLPDKGNASNDDGHME